MMPYDEEVSKLYLSGMSVRDIAKKVGLNWQTVYTSLKRSKTPKRSSDTTKKPIPFNDGSYYHYCHKCGKGFVVLSPIDWVYKRAIKIRRTAQAAVTDKTVYYCSYTCFRKDSKD